MQGVRQKSTAGVSGIHQGHFFAVRRSRYPHICKREVINMLVAEYDYDTDIAVQRAEERQIAFADGSYQKALETARILKQLGDSVKKIMQATGLTQEEVESIR